MTRPTKVHRVEVLIIDHDDLGAEGVRLTLEHTKYPNRCISPDVKYIETREVEWSDEHPLNKRSTADSAYRDLFGDGACSQCGSEGADDDDDACVCQATGRLVGELAEVTPGGGIALVPAPTWCPLRAGPVTVRAPEGRG